MSEKEPEDAEDRKPPYIEVIHNEAIQQERASLVADTLETVYTPSALQEGDVPQHVWPLLLNCKDPDNQGHGNQEKKEPLYIWVREYGGIWWKILLSDYQEVGQQEALSRAKRRANTPERFVFHDTSVPCLQIGQHTVVPHVDDLAIYTKKPKET